MHNHLFSHAKPKPMRVVIFFLSAFLFLLPGPTASAQWCQRISADNLAPGVNLGLTQNDGSHWVAGMYRGFLEIPGPAGPVQFTSPTSGDPTEYRYTGFIARYLPDGSLAWAKEIRSNFNRLRIQQLTAAPDGSVLVTGSYTGPIVFNLGETDQFVLQGTNESIFMARFQANGGLLWAKALPGNGLFFQDVNFAHWHNNEIFIGVRLNNGDIDFDPGSGTTRIFAPFLLPNQQNYCYGRYTAAGDFVAAGPLVRGPQLGVGQLISVGQKLALPITFGDTVQLLMGQTSAQQILRAPGIHAALVLTNNLTAIQATYQTAPAQISDSTTGFFIDAAVIDNKIHQFIGVGLGSLRINPANPNDTIVNNPGSSYTQYEVILDTLGSYQSHRLLASFSGQTAAARYARGISDSLLILLGNPGFEVNGVSYAGARTNELQSAVVKRTANGFEVTKTARATMLSVPIIGAAAGHSYWQIRWQDSLFLNENIYHQSPVTRQFIEVCKLNDNGISLGNTPTELKKQNVRLYPNPASNQLNLNLLTEETTLIRLINLQGQEVYRQQTNQKAVVIAIDGFTSGLYICIWESQGQNGQLKWLKQ